MLRTRNAQNHNEAQRAVEQLPVLVVGETLSPLNPMGVKGAGEAGAMEDALYDVDFEILEIPLNSNRLWEIANKRN